jgi:hypothetical protein
MIARRPASAISPAGYHSKSIRATGPAVGAGAVQLYGGRHVARESPPYESLLADIRRAYKGGASGQ